MAPDTQGNLATKLLHAAWMSIALGLLIEVALVITAALFGKADNLRPFFADLAGKTSWSVIVCVGISVGTAASRAAGPVMGLLGALAAPVAFVLAKTAHKTAAAALDVTIAASPGPKPWEFILIRALEYAILGLVVGYLINKPWGKLRAFVATGLTMGIITAALIIFLTIRRAPPGSPPPTLALVSKGVNEVLFPVGCSIVLYAINALGRRARLVAAV